MTTRKEMPNEKFVELIGEAMTMRKKAIDSYSRRVKFIDEDDLNRIDSAKDMLHFSFKPGFFKKKVDCLVVDVAYYDVIPPNYRECNYLLVMNWDKYFENFDHSLNVFKYIPNMSTVVRSKDMFFKMPRYDSHGFANAAMVLVNKPMYDIVMNCNGDKNSPEGAIFNATLLHEYGHIVMKHEASSTLEQEFEADIYAALRSLGGVSIFLYFTKCLSIAALFHSHENEDTFSNYTTATLARIVNIMALCGFDDDAIIAELKDTIGHMAGLAAILNSKPIAEVVNGCKKILKDLKWCTFPDEAVRMIRTKMRDKALSVNLDKYDSPEQLREKVSRFIDRDRIYRLVKTATNFD